MDRQSNKLAVFFPGVGYTVDKPLMHYSRKIASSAGYEIRLLPYTGFPEKIRGDKKRMQESYEIALRQSEEMLADVDFEAFDDILFVGKSVGTIVAAAIASRIRKPVRFVLYTPLEETFRFPVSDAVVFTGADDPWVGREKSRISELCRERNIPCMVIPHANHSLETQDVQADIAALQLVMKQTEKFVSQG